eukprot:18888-Heterococcus_DN1.PRE.1
MPQTPCICSRCANIMIDSYCASRRKQAVATGLSAGSCRLTVHNAPGTHAACERSAMMELAHLLVHVAYTAAVRLKVSR